MASMIDQLLEAADELLNKDSTENSDCVDCAIDNALQNDPNFGDVTANAKIADVSDNPGDLTVGPDVHQESNNCGKGTDSEEKPETVVADSAKCGKGTKCEGAEMNMDKQVQGLSESEMLTADELFNIYSEAVVEVLREAKKEIAQKYTEKKDLAKKFKAKKLAEKNKAAKKQKLEEAAMNGNFNTVMEQILDAR